MANELKRVIERAVAAGYETYADQHLQDVLRSKAFCRAFFGDDASEHYDAVRKSDDPLAYYASFLE